MDIVLFNNTSEKNKIGKNLSTVNTLSGYLKESTSITHPVILIEYASPVGFNYVYIQEFSRYYYVIDATVVRQNLIRLSLAVDVLESFKTQILAQPAIVDKNEVRIEKYLPDENLITLVKTKTDIVNFPSGLLDTGEYILITAGG